MIQVSDRRAGLKFILSDICLYSLHEITDSWIGYMIFYMSSVAYVLQLRYWLDGDDIRTASDVRVGKVDSAIIYGIQKNYLYCLRVLGFSIGGDGTMSELVYFTLGEDSISSLNSLMSHRDVQIRERPAVLHVSIP